MADLKWPKDGVDFIDDFLGRRCSTCRFFTEPSTCAILTYPVHADAYCDGWQIKEGMESEFDDTTPSLRLEATHAAAPHDDKATPRYYDNLVGICCNTCRYWVDPENNEAKGWCSIVEGEISRVCCCDMWDDGYNEGGPRMRLEMAEDLIADEEKQVEELIDEYGIPDSFVMEESKMKKLKTIEIEDLKESVRKVPKEFGGGIVAKFNDGRSISATDVATLFSRIYEQDYTVVGGSMDDVGMVPEMSVEEYVEYAAEEAEIALTHMRDLIQDSLRSVDSDPLKQSMIDMLDALNNAQSKIDYVELVLHDNPGILGSDGGPAPEKGMPGMEVV